MKDETPHFEVMSVDSMQWNRTMQVRILDAVQNEESTRDVELSGEALDAIKAQIQKQLADLKGDLKLVGLKAEVKSS